LPREVFVAGQVLTAAELNVVSDQSVMVFAGTAARGSAIPSPTEGMVTYRSDDDLVEVFDGSAFVGVGQGKILQVVSTTKTDTFTTTSATYTAVTGLSASITPSSTSSKVLVTANFTLSNTVGLNTGQGGAFAQLIRGATPLYLGDSSSSRIQASAGGGIESSTDITNATIVFLDSPNTTSATTYQIEVRRGGGNTVVVGRSGADTDTANNGRFPSSITVMEVAG